jgi:hypothetical protein
METFEELSEKYNWIAYNEQTGEVDVFLDNHMMQSFRSCEAYFDLNILQRRQLKSGNSWSLEFGIVFHSVMELLYQNKLCSADKAVDVMQMAHVLWIQHKMDEKYKEHKSYKSLGGFEGFIGLIVQYSSFYNQDLERLRPIAIEVPFGRSKEVLLGSYDYYPDGGEIDTKINCYLTGRIDFLMDSGSAIGPMDHKTTAFFKGNPMLTYEVHEGMTGYIYATHSLIKRMFPELAERRATNMMWINFIQIAFDSDNNKRFKRLPLLKTPYQLAQYAARQVNTIKHIVEMLIEERTPVWNTSMCNNFFHSSCLYQPVHRQGSESSMFTILDSDYKVGEEWSPERED